MLAKLSLKWQEAIAAASSDEIGDAEIVLIRVIGAKSEEASHARAVASLKMLARIWR